MAAFDALMKKDFVLIHGGGDIFEGTALNIDAITLCRIKGCAGHHDRTLEGRCLNGRHTGRT